MSRQHTIEETIQDKLPRGILIAALKEKGLIPNEWEFCSIQVTQKSAGDEIDFVAKRSYAAQNLKDNESSAGTAPEGEAGQHSRP